MESSLLLPDLDDPDARPFWDACADGRLTVQACADCGAIAHPPRPMCPACRSLARNWQDHPGTGTIWSYVVPHPPLLPAYSPLAPFVVVLVELDGLPNVRMAGNLVTEAGAPINSVDPAVVAVGDRVRVVFETVDDVTLPRWIRVP
jgi:uncharacterized OB-fold protein